MKPSFRRVANLALVVALLTTACSPPHPFGDGTTKAPPLILVSFDGFRHDYLDDTELPTLNRLAAEGLRADSLMHVFPTKTFATHYALATGLYAEHSGVVANNMWDPERRARFSLGNRDAVGDGYWYAGEPIWNTVEKAGRIAATYFWPGSEAQIDGIRPTYWKPYAGGTPHDERVDQVLAWLDLPREQRPDFITLYFSAVDSAGHRHGPEGKETRAAMREVDRALGRLVTGLRQRGLFGKINLLVTSDHGMARVETDHIVVLDDMIDIADIMVSDSGPAAQLWTVDGGPDAEAVLAAIDTSHPGIRRAWKRGHSPRRYHFDDHRRVPDLTIEAEPGWLIYTADRAARSADGELGGMHGWDPAWLPMHGIFLAHGPAFEAGERLPALRSIDLYSLLAALMEIEPAATDGSLAAFGPLLEHDTPITVAETRWICASGDEFATRSAPGAAALHAGEFVIALPQAVSASGARYADSGTEFWNRGEFARIVFDGEDHGECSRVAH